MIKGKNYCITKENLLGHEMIGMDIEVSNSYDKNKIGIKGKIVDETKNLFIVESEVNGKFIEKKLPKKEVWIRFDIDGKQEVKGEKLIAKPEDRTKLFLRGKIAW